MADTLEKPLGDYVLESLLSEGAQGKIYRARCVAAENPGVAEGGVVALKVLRGGSEGPEFEREFKAQTDRIRALSHPNVVRYLDAFVVKDDWGNTLPCLVMELMDGEDLRHCIQRHTGGLAWERVQSIFAQVLDGLVYVYEQGVGHHHIKSSNIYLMQDGTVRITDFAVRQAEGKTVTSDAASKATFDFMAPDFLSAEDRFVGDEISDVFSLGVCFYEALSGALPYATDREPGLMGYLKRWQEDARFEPEFPARVFRVLNDAARTVTRRAMERDRKARFGSFQEMRDAFGHIQRRRIAGERDAFVCEEFLGKGGFGEVFRARRESDGRIVSVKHLFASHDPARFLREARLLREAPHPNLVAYEDFIKVERLDGDEYYLVMEFLEGMPHWSLRSRIRQEGALAPAEVQRLFCGYLDALYHLHTAHKKAIVHRDVTPANLYAPPWDPARPDERRPRIFDLGIARSDKTETGGNMPGNPEYMPPEFVLDPNSRGSPQSDIYNLGLCLYEALSGRPTYPRLPRDTSQLWSAMRARAEHPEPLSFEGRVFASFPKLADVLGRATDQNPRKRYATALEMKEALVSALDADEQEDAVAWGTRTRVSAPTVASVSSTVPPVSHAGASTMPAARPRYGRLAAMIALAALLVGGVIGGVVGWRHWRTGRTLAELAAWPERFTPRATDVARSRTVIEQAENLAAAGNMDASRLLPRLYGLWSGIPARFDAAFAQALARKDVPAAKAVAAEWRACLASIPYRDINMAIHTRHVDDMRGQLDALEATHERDRQEAAVAANAASIASAAAALLEALRAAEPAGWRRGMESWTAAAAGADASQLAQPAVKQTLADAATALNASVTGYVARARALRDLSEAREVVAAAGQAAMLSPEEVRRLDALTGRRETVIRLEALLPAMAAHDVTALGEAVQRWDAVAPDADALRSPPVVELRKRLADAFADSLSACIASAADATASKAATELLERADTTRLVPADAIDRLKAQLAASDRRSDQYGQLTAIRAALRDEAPASWGLAMDRLKPLRETSVARDGGRGQKLFDDLRASVLRNLQRQAAGVGGAGRSLRDELAELNPLLGKAAASGLFSAAELSGLVTAAVNGGVARVAAAAGPDTAEAWPAAIADLAALHDLQGADTDARANDALRAAADRILAAADAFISRDAPLDARTRRLEWAEAAVEAAAKVGGFFPAERVKALRDRVADARAHFVLRVENRTGESVTVTADGRDWGPVAPGESRELALKATGAETAVEMKASPAYLPARVTVKAVPGGGGALTVPAWRARPVRVDLSAIAGDRLVSVSWIRAGEAGETPIAPGDTVDPGTDYMLVFRKPGYKEQRRPLRPEPSAAPLSLTLPGPWQKSTELDRLEALEQAVGRGDSAAARAILEQLPKSALADWPEFAARYDKAQAAWRGLAVSGADSEWNDAIARWNAKDYAGGARAFAKLADRFQQSGMMRERAVAEINRGVCLFLAAPRRSRDRRNAAWIVLDACENRNLSIPADRKNEMDSLVKRFRSYRLLSERSAGLEELNLEREMSEWRPLPLP